MRTDTGATPTHQRPRKLLRRFRDGQAGSVAIEFALIGMSCLFLIVETMQAGLYFFVTAELTNATSKAMRQVMTGAVSSQGLTAAQFRTNVLCPLLPAVMPCANVITNLRSVAEDVSPNGFYQFVNSAQTAVIAPTMDNTKTNYCSGSGGTVIYAQVYYAMPAISYFWRTVGATTFNGVLVHMASAAAVFKNEPFQSSQSGC